MSSVKRGEGALLLMEVSLVSCRVCSIVCGNYSNFLLALSLETKNTISDLNRVDPPHDQQYEMSNFHTLW
jgi:hypothetical protein